MVRQTADQALLERPLRNLSDIEAIEQVPVNDRLTIADVSRRIGSA